MRNRVLFSPDGEVSGGGVDLLADEPDTPFGSGLTGDDVYGALDSGYKPERVDFDPGDGDDGDESALDDSPAPPDARDETISKLQERLERLEAERKPESATPALAPEPEKDFDTAPWHRAIEEAMEADDLTKAMGYVLALGRKTQEHERGRFEKTLAGLREEMRGEMDRRIASVVPHDEQVNAAAKRYFARPDVVEDLGVIAPEHIPAILAETRKVAKARGIDADETLVNRVAARMQREGKLTAKPTHPQPRRRPAPNAAPVHGGKGGGRAPEAPPRRSASPTDPFGDIYA